MANYDDPFMAFNFDTVDIPLHDPTSAQNEFDPAGHLTFNQDVDVTGLGSAFQDSLQGSLPFDPSQFDLFPPAQDFSQPPQSATPHPSSQTHFANPATSRPETPSQTLTAPNAAQVPPKVGTRFSKESLRVLRNWLSIHSSHPFPTDEERQVLERQTGLTKTQILNWLANARRRGKIPDFRTVSPRTQSPSSKPKDIPRRAGTPAPRDGTPFMNPLERWVDSPPENEPAEATAIARAVATSSQFGAFSSPLTPVARQSTDLPSQITAINATIPRGIQGLAAPTIARPQQAA